jgi:hypothetical protein
MITAYDDVIDAIVGHGYHNHRKETHSEAMSRGILRDLRAACEPFELDFTADQIRAWLDRPSSAAGRARKADLIVAEPGPDSLHPDLSRLRLCIENKSVVTAHRNRTNRYDDLSDLVGVLHRKRPDAILVATVLVGLCETVLNVPDRVKPFLPLKEFNAQVLPRLSTGDASLWAEFPSAVSRNRAKDPALTLEKFRNLPTRPPGRTDLVAYDYVLLVPVFIDNVNPPRIARENDLGIDPDAEYKQMLDQICKAYTARWHL